MSPEKKPDTSWLNAFAIAFGRYVLPALALYRLIVDIVNEESSVHPAVAGMLVLLIIGYYTAVVQHKITNKEDN